ncbi:oligosaccharide flippase family protein [Novosphingobium piscinae]|uniref:Oligosaccharide flippase family protein n=1 Tax=Novosphingobium piscinae TaxID=1507448 RepID=A0A7X1G116_9SPHN|nr:oligosaccharide flippase family protein [Novosphingobium piscinae]MBC2670698.1 oligosaccharide flippase family protein [Novosphingobium piscinae]
MSLRRSALWSMATQYGSFLCQFASSVVISRFFLRPAEVGLFSIALAAAMMAAIFQDMGISRFVTGQPDMREAHVRDYAGVAVALGWLVAAGIALAALPLAWFYGEPGLAPLMLIIALAYAAMPLAIVPAALLTRAMNFRVLFFANTGSALLGAGASIGAAAAGAGPAALAWGMLTTTLTRLAVVQVARPVLPRRPRRAETVRPMLGFSGASFAISLSGAIGMRSQDLIVGHLLGLFATGIFTRATALAGQLSTLVVGALNAVFYPAFARKRDAGEDLAGPYLHLIACNTALNWAAAAGLAAAAGPLVHLLYGPRWAEVAPLLRWTALAEMLFFAVPLQMDVPIMLGRIRSLVWINCLDTAATVGILAAFCAWGVEAAAVSRLVAAGLWFVIYITFIGRLLHLPVAQLAGIYLRSGLCAAAAAAPLYGAVEGAWFGPTPGLPVLLGLGLCGAVAWLALLALLRHPAWQEVRLALNLLPRPRALQPG